MIYVSLISLRSHFHQAACNPILARMATDDSGNTIPSTGCAFSLRHMQEHYDEIVDQVARLSNLSNFELCM